MEVVSKEVFIIVLAQDRHSFSDEMKWNSFSILISSEIALGISFCYLYRRPWSGQWWMIFYIEYVWWIHRTAHCTSYEDCLVTNNKVPERQRWVEEVGVLSSRKFLDHTHTMKLQEIHDNRDLFWALRFI